MKQAEQEAMKGTLKDLCDSYVANMWRQKKKSARQVETCLARYVLKPFPTLAATKAAEITAGDIVSILKRMIENGITTTSNRVRSYLHTAFEYGIRSDNDPLHQVEQAQYFLLDHNPVSAVPRQPSFERVRERYLDHSEIKALWFDFGKAMTRRSPVYGLMIRFMFATAGNRPEQLSHCRWSDIDFNKRIFSFIDSKGKDGKPKKRVMPLTNRAVKILEQAKMFSGSSDWVFSVSNDKPIRVSTLANRLEDYCDYLESDKKRPEQAERFTAKDIRRTVTNLLIECGIPREQRFLLQSREDGSVESKHYDQSDRLAEKRVAIEKYDALLEAILYP
ncbi:tyrosine-type recombinase/integrase [Endozoicomonas gorgoniicola]|uniref:Tyrosine-type recombinase/integrase n=1 Tax=Endozoicomonas gorgoniicola TaxID=1234144 RepID=A0ABT3N247_9GAMM|nr:tyrosine-type recombinase/integrase [Endozoicomonas gorgoniicola]MCW7555684.1 tyrosine-type recombinase/integrase [Endozoicomonas gorgoniicola]